MTTTNHYRRILTDDNLSARLRFFGNQVFSQRPSERQPNREGWAAQRTIDGLRSKSAAGKASRAALSLLLNDTPRLRPETPAKTTGDAA